MLKKCGIVQVIQNWEEEEVKKNFTHLIVHICKLLVSNSG
jgi:hypothetical protein